MSDSSAPGPDAPLDSKVKATAHAAGNYLSGAPFKMVMRDADGNYQPFSSPRPEPPCPNWPRVVAYVVLCAVVAAILITGTVVLIARLP